MVHTSLQETQLTQLPVKRWTIQARPIIIITTIIVIVIEGWVRIRLGTTFSVKASTWAISQESSQWLMTTHRWGLPVAKKGNLSAVSHNFRKKKGWEWASAQLNCSSSTTSLSRTLWSSRDSHLCPTVSSRKARKNCVFRRCRIICPLRVRIKIWSNFKLSGQMCSKARNSTRCNLLPELSHPEVTLKSLVGMRDRRDSPKTLNYSGSNKMKKSRMIQQYW